MDEEVSTEDIQSEIIESYLDEMDAVHTEGFEGKIIFQIPNKLFTTRYLHIPVKQEKKAEQMIPFQLDDELPYTIPELHYVNKFTKVEEGSTPPFISRIFKTLTNTTIIWINSILSLLY